MANLNFEFKDYSNIVLEKMHNASMQGMDAAKNLAKESVQYQMLYGYKDRHGKDGHTEIVDTGALFDSIDGVVERGSSNLYTVSIGTDIKYAVFVHNGTSKLKGRPFIRDGIMKAQADIKAALEDAFENA